MVEDRIEYQIEITPKVRRQIQLIQLEILIEIDRICRKNDIPYRITGGTLLGAIRHKGFIPWDPDADVGMNRMYYEKFYEVCKTDLDTERFFFQDWRTDPNYRWMYGRILRKDTEFVRAGHEHLGQKTGVFVDLLCSDAVPDIAILRPFHCFACFACRKILWSKVGKKLHNNWFLRKWYAFLSLIPRDWVFKFIYGMIGCMSKKPHRINRNLAHKVSKHSKSPWGYPVANYAECLANSGDAKKAISRLVNVEFEGYTFYAVQNYELSLKNCYGNYMELPPKEKRVTHIPCSKLKLTIPRIDNYDELMKKVYEE